MLKQRLKAAAQVSVMLHDAEAALDVALAKAAALAGALPQARAEANLSALYGQDAMERVVEALASLSQARRGLIETHKELAVTRRQLGLDAYASGPDLPKPPVKGEAETPTPASTPHLRPVAVAA